MRIKIKLSAGLIITLFTGPIFSTAQLTNNGATIVMSSGTNLVMQDISLQNNGIFDQPAGTVIFMGAANSYVAGNTSPLFHILQLNKPGATLELQVPVTIHNTLQFTNGLLNLNGQNILLDNVAMLAGETETSHIYGNAGYVQIVLPMNAPAQLNAGNLGVEISSSQNLGTTIIQRGHRSQTNGTGGGNSVLRYYDIIPANNVSLNATLRFNYLNAELNGLNENQLTVWKSNNNVNWFDLGRTSQDAGINYVELTGINNFARFTLSTIGNALPLVWGSFNTQCISGQVRLTWKTEQEQNVSQFLIRRSVDGNTWSQIGTLPATGNSNVPVTYTYTDPQPLQDAIYYQVQAKDIDGKITTSPVLINRCGAGGNGLKVFPNPVQTSCWVSIQSAESGIISMQLYDSKGALIQQRKETLRNGSTQVELRLDGLASGLYSLVVTLPNGNSETVKIEKQ